MFCPEVLAIFMVTFSHKMAFFLASYSPETFVEIFYKMVCLTFFTSFFTGEIAKQVPYYNQM